MNRGMQIAIGVVGVLVALVLLLVGLVATRPSTSHIERSATYAAAPQDVYPYINDYKKFLEWNPWTEMEPTAKTTVSEPSTGVGANYAWKGEMTGEGKMTITESVPNQKVVSNLEFTAPFVSQALVTMTLIPEGDKTKLVWAYDQSNIPFMEKGAGLMMDMDAMLGGDFSKGLANLGPKAEADAKARLEKEAADKLAAEKAAADAAAGVVTDVVAPAPK